MKGITPVIAIILLMLITISMVGFAFVWFNRVTSEIGGEITEATQETVKQSQTRVTIDNINPATDTIYIRNSGSVDIIFDNDISIYVDGATITTCVALSSDCDGSTLTPGDICTCVSSVVLSTCSTIKITSPGMGDTAAC